MQTRSIAKIVLLTLTACAWGSLNAGGSIGAAGELDSLYRELEGRLASSRIYCELKENRIEALKRERGRETGRDGAIPGPSPERAYELGEALAGEYRNFVSDSAIFYMASNLEIACALGDRDKINATLTAEATFFASLGSYKEALDALSDIDRAHLAPRQLVDYYNAYRRVYGGLGYYSQNSRLRGRYRATSETYRDSMMSVASPCSEEYLATKESMLRSEGDLAGAMRINDSRMSLAAAGTPRHALAAFHRSLIYREMGNREMEKQSLVQSAISDVQCSIRDNASLPLLADILTGEGDIARAYRYVKYCLDNTAMFNARIRTSEVINIQKIIDEAWRQKTRDKERKLKVAFIVISLLSVLLGVLTVRLYKQMKRSLVVSRQLEKSNEELLNLNRRERETNDELLRRNMEVTEANCIKEEYITSFLGMSSSYIDKIDALRMLVNKKLRAREIEDLYKITRDGTFKERELKELHANFDAMFTRLYPDFIEKFNSLLLPGEQIVLRKGEILTIELRIYALVRLGIDDCVKIADFLGYSVSTIYNYRTKIKNKARIPRADFEEMVKRIGTFSRE